jgi:hypothetical protein
MSTVDACGILTIKHSLAVITNMAQKQNECHGCMWNSNNQALTYCDHKHNTEAEWAPWMHVKFWQSSTHFLWSQTWHRSRIRTVDACGILIIKHSLAVIRNMAQKQNVHWMHVEFWQSSTHTLWSQTWHRSRMSAMDACGILTIMHSHPVNTNMA